jgi:hypothetical protein
MPIWPYKRGCNMSVKLSSVVMVLMVCFIAKISFETATTKKENAQTAKSNERSPASIDQSYHEHMNKR